MIGNGEDSIQAIQSLLERTHKGRIIKDKALPSVKAWKSVIDSEYSKTECKNCGLILKSNYFINKCLNCGSSDVKPIES